MAMIIFIIITKTTILALKHETDIRLEMIKAITIGIVFNLYIGLGISGYIVVDGHLSFSETQQILQKIEAINEKHQ